MESVYTETVWNTGMCVRILHLQQLDIRQEIHNYISSLMSMIYGPVFMPYFQAPSQPSCNLSPFKPGLITIRLQESTKPIFITTERALSYKEASSQLHVMEGIFPKLEMFPSFLLFRVHARPCTYHWFLSSRDKGRSTNIWQYRRTE